MLASLAPLVRRVTITTTSSSMHILARAGRQALFLAQGTRQYSERQHQPPQHQQQYARAPAQPRPVANGNPSTPTHPRHAPSQPYAASSASTQQHQAAPASAASSAVAPPSSSVVVAAPTAVSFSEFQPRIAVIGIGGAGGNAVNHMITSELEGVDFVVCNTDAQALSQSLTPNRVQLGRGLTRGLGAGSKPEIGRKSAEEHIDRVLAALGEPHLVFIAAGMGGGTGTGASPVIAKALRERGVLTVGVVSRPFNFEGLPRRRSADQGLNELQKYVDTMIVTHNQKLIQLAQKSGNLTMVDAFRIADEVLYQGVRTISDLIVKPGLVNLDFGDVRTVLVSSRQNGVLGKALMGTGEASGQHRAAEAAEAATTNPLLDDVSLDGARGLLINISGGPDLTMHEVQIAAEAIQQKAHPDADIVWGACQEEALKGKIRVSIVATGLS